MECCVYVMYGEFSGSFPDYTIFICKFKTDECFLFMKHFQFTGWRHLKIVRQVKHIMIMIIDYNFLSYVIFDQQLKITFRKSSGAP